ncbi:kinectin isoform X1 [Microplitis demolitor]|uniref:kinectin isoform X1 n=1 Tax=Microplitis demolitor TaxID=69319 RepID=UPI0004CCDE1E|nr:kinectin isoform X1 [Microplitis demolitor]XP_008558285.1 kinectin isoform X1 [Microplitis demolitor]
MDFQTTLIYGGVVVVSAAVIFLVSVLGIKEKSYEEAIAEQRKLPDDLLLGKKDKGKDKKHKSKTGKKVKEKKDDKDDKDDKQEHVQFEDTPQILPDINVQDVGKGNKKKSKPEKVKPILVNKDESPVVTESIASQPPLVNVNHFDVIHPKDDLELIRSQSKENLQQATQSEPVTGKSSPRETPTKSKKNVVKEPVKKKEESKDDKKESNVNVNAAVQQTVVKASASLAEQAPTAKESKEPQQKDVQQQKDTAISVQPTNKEVNKKNKKKNDILAQIGGDKDGINVSLLMPLVQKAELSRSEIQILIDLLLNKQLDNPQEVTEWTEGRADPVIKLKKQLSEKEKALSEEHEASLTYQNKLKELRAELNSERSRLTGSLKQLEEALNAKITEAQTLHTRMQHILESHAAEKQGFARQIEQLQAKVNEDATIIHKMQEDQGQTQGHLQQELIAQRKQLDIQFAQMRENENSLKAQLSQKQMEYDQLHGVHISITSELTATVDSNSNEIDMLRQQLGMMQEQFMHSEGQLQNLRDSEVRLQEMARQLEESHRANADLDHRLKNLHRHEQELQKQVHSLQNELKVAKAEAGDATALNEELNKVQTELNKLKSDLSVSQNEAKTEAIEITNLKNLLADKEEEVKILQQDLLKAQQEVREKGAIIAISESLVNEARNESTKARAELTKAVEDLKQEKNRVKNLMDELKNLKAAVNNQETGDVKLLKAEIEQLQNGDKKSSAIHLEIIKLQEENERLKDMQRTQEDHGQIDALKSELMKKQAEFNQLKAQVESLQRDANNHSSLTKRLQDDLEAQRLKNNELRTKNWKVMEALSAAESRVKSNPRKSIDESIESVKNKEQETTKSLLQRIFPEISVTEKSFDKWLTTFEERVQDVLQNKNYHDSQDVNSELEKQNKNLQGLVAHYKQIIIDTEGMLNNLQNNVESEESRWKAGLRQKENEVISLRLELQEIKNKTTINDKIHEQKDTCRDNDGVEFAFSCIEKSLPTITKELQEKISQLESRLKEEEALKDKANIVTVKTTYTSPIKTVNFANVEQLQEEKQRLSQDLETERTKNKVLDNELGKLRSLVENSEATLNQEKTLVSKLQQEVSRLKNEATGACSSLDQSVNGPSSECMKPEQMRATQSLLAAIEKTLIKNPEPENCSITSTKLVVESQQDYNRDSFTSELNSDNCHTAAYDVQSINGQQHKKHKKKRKGGSGKK